MKNLESQINDKIRFLELKNVQVAREISLVL